MSAQRWCRGLRPLKTNLRQFHSSTSTEASAVPALSDVQSSASGFFSKLFGGQPQRSLVPMTEALPDVHSTFMDSPPSTAPKTEMSTLSNGFKVATEATVVSELPLMVSSLLWASCDEAHTPCLLAAGTHCHFGHLC